MSYSRQNLALILCLYARRGAAAATTIEAKVEAGMRAVLTDNHFGASDEELLHAAVAGVLLDVGLDSPVGCNLQAEYNFLCDLSRALAGGTLDLATLPTESTPVIGLVPRWLAIKTALGK